MGNHEFQGSLYRNEREMLDAIAYAWVGGGDSRPRIHARDHGRDKRRRPGRRVHRQRLGTGTASGTPAGDGKPYIDGDLVLAFTRLRERLEAE